MALFLGITGGIGSGKSLVCRMFAALGVPVFYADIQAKILMDRNADIRQSLIKWYGPDIYDNRGSLNRQRLGEIIFQQPAERQRVNNLVHPLVGQAFRQWASQQATPYVIEEAAILFESGAHQQMDAVALVFAPEEMRIQRVMQRDNLTREQVLHRIRSQMPEEEKRKRADFVIMNDNQASLINQVLKIHNQLTNK